MEKATHKTSAGQGLSIAGFVLGAIAIVVCWIPCFGVWAILPGGIGIILSAIALAQASRGNGRKGFIIAGLVISIVSTSIAIWQYFALQKATNQFKQGLEDMGTEWENALEDMEDDGFFDNFEEALEELEEGMQETTNDINEENWDTLINDGDYSKLIDEYELMVNEYIEFVKKAESGDISAITAYMKVNSKLMIFTMKLATVMPKLTTEQVDRFNEIDAKYKEYYQE